MSMMTTTCPHCSAAEIALKVKGIDPTRSDGIVNIYTTCPRCNRPSCHELRHSSGARVTQNWFAGGEARDSSIEILAKSGYSIIATFPLNDTPQAPADTPPEIERIYLQARSTHKRTELDAAAMLYRKTLETAVKSLDPVGKGSLDSRIKALSKSDLIPEAVATWAHEIRGIGNEAAHDADEPSAQDVAAAAEFVEAFLTYAYTMPAKIKNRLTKPEEPLAAQ